MADENKLKALDIAVGQIEKQHGKGTIMKLGDGASQDVDVISTGSIMVDYALGVQGFQEEELPRFTVRKLRVKQHLLFR